MRLFNRTMIGPLALYVCPAILVAAWLLCPSQPGQSGDNRRQSENCSSWAEAAMRWRRGMRQAGRGLDWAWQPPAVSPLLSVLRPGVPTCRSRLSSWSPSCWAPAWLSYWGRSACPPTSWRAPGPGWTVTTTPRERRSTQSSGTKVAARYSATSRLSVSDRSLSTAGLELIFPRWGEAQSDWDWVSSYRPRVTGVR